MVVASCSVFRARAHEAWFLYAQTERSRFAVENLSQTSLVQREPVSPAPVWKSRNGNIVFGSAIQALVAVIIMLTINPLITLVVFVPLAGLSMLMNRMSARIQKYHHESRKAAGEVSSFIGEMFNTTQAIQLANAQLRVIAHLRQLNDARRHTKLRSFFFTDVVLNSIAQNTANLGTGVILLLAVQAMKSGSFSVGSLALFVAYLDEFAPFTALFFQELAMYKQAGISLQRLQSALPAGVPRSTVVAHAPVYLRGAYPEVPAPQRQARPLEHLEVRGLTYRYAQSGSGIEQIDLQLQRGSCTVITGRIDSGKTTLLRAYLPITRQSGKSTCGTGMPVFMKEKKGWNELCENH